MDVRTDSNTTCPAVFYSRAGSLLSIIFFLIIFISSHIIKAHPIKPTYPTAGVMILTSISNGIYEPKKPNIAIIKQTIANFFVYSFVILAATDHISGTAVVNIARA